MSKPILFTNALHIDGTDRDAVQGASVLVGGQAIRQVSTTPLEVPPEVESIDLKGRVLLPGLMDGHVYVVITGDIAALLSSGGFPPGLT